MFKRILLALTFVAAFGAVGVVTSSQAVAHDCGYGGYGYRAAYYPGYAPYYAYPAPRVAYYPGSYAPAYPMYYGGPRPHRHHHHNDGISISFGF